MLILDQDGHTLWRKRGSNYTFRIMLVIRQRFAAILYTVTLNLTVNLD